MYPSQKRRGHPLHRDYWEGDNRMVIASQETYQKEQERTVGEYGEFFHVLWIHKKGGTMFKKRVLALVLSASMIVSQAPVALADTSTEEASITAAVTIQSYAAGSLLAPISQEEVSSTEAEDYGFTDDFDGEKVSALDALVKATELVYGDDFTKETASDYLVVSGGLISKFFGVETYGAGFYINHMYPHDGTASAWGGYNGYTIANAELKDCDTIEFFVYQDDNYLDYYTYFEEDGEKSYALDAIAGEEFTLTLKGYYLMMGYQGEETCMKREEAMEGFQVCLLDENGQTSPISGAITDENGQAKLTFQEPGTYQITTLGSDQDEEYPTYAQPTVATVYVTGKATPSYDDDLWLQYDYKELRPSESAYIYPRRVTQIIDSPVSNKVSRPNFHYEVVSGDSVALSSYDSREKVRVDAKKEGTTIIKVSYDALYANEKTYAANYPANEAYVVYRVSENQSSCTVSTGIDLTSYDTVYFAEGNSIDYTFTPSVSEETATIQSVTVNGNSVSANADGSYTAALENCGNIITVTALDSENKEASVSQVVDARKIDVNVENLTATRENNQILDGDTVKITLSGVVLPVYKLATIYNPTVGAWGSEKRYFAYSLDNTSGIQSSDSDTSISEGQLRAYGHSQYSNDDISIQVTFDNYGTYHLTDGQIHEGWWGSGLGADKLVENGGKANLNAPVCVGDFSILPEITLKVAAKSIDEYKAEAKVAEEEASSKAAELESVSKAAEEASSKAAAELESANKAAEEASSKAAAELESASKAAEEASSKAAEAESAKKVAEEASSKEAEVNEIIKNTNISLCKEVEALNQKLTEEKIAGAKSAAVTSLKVKMTNKKAVSKALKKGKSKKAKMTISWTKADTQNVKYQVYCKLASGKYKLITTTESCSIKNTVKLSKKKKSVSYKIIPVTTVDGLEYSGQAVVKTIKGK